jgi:hypothetical protein
MIKIILTL